MRRKSFLVLRSLGAGLVLLSAGSCVVAQPGGGDPSPHINPDGVGGGGSDSQDGSGFRYYFSVTSDPWEKSQGRDWAGQLEFDTSVMSKDFVILYQHLTGNYPKAGPHLSMAPGYMEAHLQKLALDVKAHIPDPEFSGIAILDFECFPAIWDRAWNRPSNLGPEALDEDLRDDWTDYIRSTHPDFDGMSESDQDQLLRESWEAAVRDLFLNSINKAREVRPNAKWGFYGYPYRFYSLRREVPRGVIAYGDGSHNGSRLNDRLQWMWDAVDVVTPSVYARRVVMEDDGSCQDFCSAAQDLEYVQNMIGEARRVANGKPVYPFISVYYNLQHGCFEGEELNDANLWGQIMGPALAGADGACLWGDADNRDDHERWQSFLDRRIMPLMEQGVASRQGDGSGRRASDDEGSDDAPLPARRQGVVSLNPDRPQDPGARRRAGTKATSIRFNPATDRISTASKPAAAPAGAIRVPVRRVANRVSALRYNPATDRISTAPQSRESAVATKRRADAAEDPERD